MVRILILAGVMALNGLILMIVIGENEFAHIISNMNNNVYELTKEQGSLYNLYYYTGFNVLYKPLFSITIMLVFVSVAAVLLRFGNAGKLAFLSNAMLLITGGYLLIARIFEGSSKVHYYIDSLYMNVSDSETIETVQLMDTIPVAYCLVIILSVIGFLLVRSSSIGKMKLYAVKNDKSNNCVRFIMPAVYGYAVMELARESYIGMTVSRMSSDNQLTYQYLHDFYIADKAFLSWSGSVVFGIVIAINMMLKHYGKENLKNILAGLVLPGILTIITGIIMAINIPSVFGILTFDVIICDKTDTAYYMFIICRLAEYLCVFSMIWSVVNRKIPVLWMKLVFVANVLLSVITLGLATFADNYYKMYAGCIAADVITVVIVMLLIFYASVLKKKSMSLQR